jgi:rod shape-determining protein MreD
MIGRSELVSVGKVVLLLLIGALLQVLLISRVSVLGVTADLFLILTVIVGFNKGSLKGAIFGFFAGLAAGIAFFEVLGLRAFALVLVGYFVGVFYERFTTASIWAILALAAVASFSGQMVFGILQFMMSPRDGFLTLVGAQMVPEALLDALVTIPVYILLVRLHVISPAATTTTSLKEGPE